MQLRMTQHAVRRMAQWGITVDEIQVAVATGHVVEAATLERDHAIVVIRKVPAVVCGQCGESYFDGPTAARLLILVDAVIASGAKIEIRDYAA